MTDTLAPSLDDIRDNAKRIEPHVLKTPIHTWRGRELEALLPADTEVVTKLEMLQRSGTFKARGAITNMLRLTEQERSRGVTAVSAGNHAIAVSYAANALGIDAKVVMQSSANAARIAAAEALGSTVLLGGDGPSSFALAEQIASEEGRTFIHPFEGPGVALGTATLGLEFAEQAGALDALILPIGGGGLAGGVSAAIKAINPDCHIYGVEPEGADTMHRSFAAGEPQTISKVSTIADSLGPPMSLPYSYGLCRAFVDELIRIDDAATCSAMALIFRELKFALEPAACVSTAALIGPLRDRLKGKRVGIIFCGANIDIDTFAGFVSQGQQASK